MTRPRAQAQAWVHALREVGVDAHALPLIEIAAAPDSGLLAAAWQALSDCALVVFVSANAAQHFFDVRPPGLAWPAHTLAGSTGRGTSAALRHLGVPPEQLVEPAPGQMQESESLWLQLQARPWRGQRVLVVRGEGGRDWLAERLGQAEAQVEFLAAYRRLPPVLQATEQALLDQALSRPEAYAWLFSSSQALRHLPALLPTGREVIWAGALCTHERIAQAASDAGFARTQVVTAGADAEAATVESTTANAMAQSVARALVFLQSPTS